MLDWMVVNFDNGTLCEWDNPQHFVCASAAHVFTAAIEYGTFGTRNLFTLYPIFPWCFLFGFVGALVIALPQRYGPSLRAQWGRSWRPATFAYCDRWVFGPLSALHYFNPALLLLGLHTFTGGQNLSYKTNELYLSVVFMWHIKRRYSAWWEKYNYILKAGFDVGVAVSGVVQTLAFSFGTSHIAINWWGNAVSTAGVDYQAYQNKAALLEAPKGEHFGLKPDQYPTHF